MAVKYMGGVGLAQLVKRVKADRTLKAGEVTPDKVGNKQQLRADMGLGNTLGALPITNGGTGCTNITDVRKAVLNFPEDNDELCEHIFGS